LKRTTTLGLLIALGLLVAPGLPAEDTPPPRTDPRALRYPSLSISFPKPEKVALSNGLVAYLFRDNELPIIDLSLYARAGSIDDPPDKAGLAEIAAHLLRTGGTDEMTPDQVDEALEFMPARVSLGAGSDSVSGSVSALKARFPEGLRIFSRMLRAPRFDPARLEIERARILEEVRRRWDDPGTVADLNFRLLVYGQDSPWARLESAASIGRITRQDLIDFQQNTLRPGNVVIGVAGDFEPEAMKRLLRDVFGPWKDARVKRLAIAKIADRVTPGTHLIERPLTQSSIEIGHLGVNRFDPDKFPLKILSFILGEGGFSSRLMKEVRSTRGLAYSVGGGVGIDSDRGLFDISCTTKAGSTVASIKVIRDIVRQLREEGPTDEEVLQAKEAETNSFVFSVEGTSQYMRTHLYYAYYGYPPDYLQTYRDNIAKVTRADVLRAARKHMDPDRLVVLVVGNPKEFDAPLASLGMGDPKELRLGD
jgi:predicted Zn-dependent peptidase